MVNRSISKQTLLRLPLYLNYMKQLGENTPEHISATTIAEALRLNHVVVRKDLAAVSSAGKPKVGYNTEALIAELEEFLGYNDVDDAIIVGAGKLGKALLTYGGFKDCGMNIVAAFDIDEEVCEEDYSGKRILTMDKLMDLCERMRVRASSRSRQKMRRPSATCSLKAEFWLFGISRPCISMCRRAYWYITKTSPRRLRSYLSSSRRNLTPIPKLAWQKRKLPFPCHYISK